MLTVLFSQKRKVRCYVSHEARVRKAFHIVKKWQGAVSLIIPYSSEPGCFKESMT
jgi:hypothetical protein